MSRGSTLELGARSGRAEARLLTVGRGATNAATRRGWQDQRKQSIASGAGVHNHNMDSSGDSASHAVSDATCLGNRTLHVVHDVFGHIDPSPWKQGSEDYTLRYPCGQPRSGYMERPPLPPRFFWYHDEDRTVARSRGIDFMWPDNQKRWYRVKVISEMSATRSATAAPEESTGRTCSRRLFIERAPGAT